MVSLARRGLGVAALAAGLGLPALSSPLSAQARCTEWTDWSPVPPAAVLWSWRWCEASARRYDVQWRFANHGTEPLEFRYEFYTGMPVACGEKSRGRVFARGKYRLQVGQRDERYSGRRSLRATGFEEQFWLYICVFPLQPEPGEGER